MVDIGSFEVLGIDSSEMNQLNLCRPLLISPLKENELKKEKLLHLEFESNPLNSKADYRVKGASQSLQINYHAVSLRCLYLCKIIN